MLQPVRAVGPIFPKMENQEALQLGQLHVSQFIPIIQAAHLPRRALQSSNSTNVGCYPGTSGWRNLCWCLLHLLFRDILVNLQVFRFLLGFFDLKFPSCRVDPLSELVCGSVFQALIIRIQNASHGNIRTRRKRFNVASRIYMMLNR